MKTKKLPQSITCPSLIPSLIALDHIDRQFWKDLARLADLEHRNTPNPKVYQQAFDILRQSIIKVSTERIIAELDNA